MAALACHRGLADTPSGTAAALQGDPGRPAAAHWVRGELYFGVGRLDGPDPQAREARWRSFLDREVTPRFPDGLTVLEAYGQWRSKGSDTPSRLVSKVLVILFEDTPANREAIDAIRSAYKVETRSKSVLLVTQPAEVSF